jgi:hypothetical protein
MDLGPPNYVKSPALQRECLHSRPLLTDARSPAHRCRRGELQPTSMGTDRAPIRPMRATARSTGLVTIRVLSMRGCTTRRVR